MKKKHEFIDIEAREDSDDRCSISEDEEEREGVLFSLCTHPPAESQQI